MTWFEVVNFSRNDNGVTESYIIQWLVLLFVFVPKIITLIIVSNIFPRVEIEFKLPNIIWELHFLRSALQGRDPHATLVFFNPIFFFPKVPNCFCLTEKQGNVRDVAKILNKIIPNLKQSTEFHSLKSELKKGAGHYWVKCQIALLRIPFVSEWDIHCNIGTKDPIHFLLSFFCAKIGFQMMASLSQTAKFAHRAFQLFCTAANQQNMIREINHSVTDLQSLLTLKLGLQNELWQNLQFLQSLL